MKGKMDMAKSPTDLQEENEALKDTLARLTEGAKYVGAVTSIQGNKCLVNTGDCKLFEVDLPPFPLTYGDTVNLHPKSFQITEKQVCRQPGPICIIKEIRGDLLELEGSGEQHKTVLIADTIDRSKLETGSQVLLDWTGHAVVQNLGKPAKKFQRGETVVEWDDIGGLDELKAEIQEAIEWPFLHTDLFKSYGKKPPHGILLEGDPGNGKSMFAKAIATSIGRRFGAVKDDYLSTTAFMYVKGPEILDKYVGESERKIRDIFDGAGNHHREHGFPAVIFVDEADAILSKRDSGVSSDVLKTIVPQFLVEWDGLDNTPAIMILATNRPDILDPAVTRDGRIDARFNVPRPNETAFEQIMRIYLKKIPLASRVSVEELAQAATTFVFSDDRCLGQFGTKGKSMMLYMRHVVSGAMVKNIVDHALSNAIRRDVASGRKAKPSGVDERDVFQAIKRIQSQAEKLDHSAILSKLKDEHRHAEQTKKPEGEKAVLDESYAA